MTPNGRRFLHNCKIAHGFTGRIIKARQEELVSNQSLKIVCQGSLVHECVSYLIENHIFINRVKIKQIVQETFLL